MQQLITILHLLVSICVIALVLIQRGKGSEMGAGLGGGASNTMFGSQGATPFLVKLTASLAILFFVTSGVLSFIMGRQATQAEVLPFVTAPLKTVQAIPVSSEVQSAETAEGAPSVVAKPLAKPRPTEKKHTHTQKKSSATVKEPIKKS